MATKIESWEDQAFEKDRCNAMAATWPPRSYTCSFCRREFRSAQALGGHMNVHRHDRARLRQLNNSQVLNDASTTAPVYFSSSSEVVRSNGTRLCLFYPIQSTCYEKEVGYLNASSFEDRSDGKICKKFDNGSAEELDLELRLGW